eukprot:2587245-Pleurochrysis_carterae.AAC.1
MAMSPAGRPPWSAASAPGGAASPGGSRRLPPPALPRPAPLVGCGSRTLAGKGSSASSCPSAAS